MNLSNNNQSNISQSRSSILTRSTTLRNQHNHVKQASTLNFNNSSTMIANVPVDSIVDPNDEIWLEFLTSLHEPIKESQPDEKLSSITDVNSNQINNLSNNSEQIYSKNLITNNNFSSNDQTQTHSNSSNSNYLNYDFNNFIDNDDPDQDPDFTVCLDNYDLDDPDYVDDWFQVPKKEAVALVKDAIEFCDTVPIVCDLDQRNSKIKSTRKISNEITIFERDAQVEETSRKVTKVSSNITSHAQTNEVSNQPKSIDKNKNDSMNINSQKENEKSLDENSLVESNREYIPEFDDIQRKQLDEQLRNHVQLLTQTCLISFCSIEYLHIFDEASLLLLALDDLNKPPDQTDKYQDNDALKGLLSPQFEILNLKDSIDIIENLNKMDQEKRKEFDLKKNNGMPPKLLETILNSPVFYNINLIPNCKYKYQSHFKRSQLSDSEKILLIMGFNKFKHLPKNECCQCIKQHLLPHRSCEDIKKQIVNISNSEHRQLKLKELLKAQKLNSKNSINRKNFDFIKEVDYKSPLEQSDTVQLPSMYTITIERLKMANILRDTKNHLKEKKEKANNSNNNNNLLNNNDTNSNLNDDSVLITNRSTNENITSKSVKNTKNDEHDTNQNRNKRTRRSSSCSSTTSTSDPSDISCNLSFLRRSSTSPKQISSTINATPKSSSMSQNHLDLELSTCSTSTTIQRTSDQIESIKSIRRSIIIDESNNEKNKNENNENQNQNKQSNNNIINGSFTLPLSTNSSNNLIQLGSTNFNDRSILLPAPIQPITLLKSIQQQPVFSNQPSPFLLPSNFTGTILYQPTIHIHTSSNNHNSSKKSNNTSVKKFRQIVPKK